MPNFYEFLQLLEAGPMGPPPAPPGGGPAGGGLGTPIPGMGGGMPPPPMGGGMGIGGPMGPPMGGPGMAPMGGGGAPAQTKEITKLDVWSILEKILEGKPAAVEKPNGQKGPDQLDSSQPQPSTPPQQPPPTGAPPPPGGMAGPPQPQQPMM